MSAFGSGGVGVERLNLDAFSRLRVSNPDSLFESTFQYSLDTTRFNAIVANGGTVTHLPNESSARLATVAAAGSSAIVQSRAYHRYLPAKSQFTVMTFVLEAGVAGIVKRVGYFDANDGLFLEQNGTVDVAVVRRTSTSGAPVDNRVVQASWNLDKLDGTGPSGVTLDLTRCQILVIDFQWLGMGRARIGLDIDGVIIWAHEFRNANVLTTPFMRTGSLPVRWEIAGNGVATMKATCSAVISEGGAEHDSGFIQAVGTDATVRTFTSGTPLPLLAVRPALLFNGITNRLQMQLLEIALLATSGAADFYWQVVHDCVITGGAWASVGATSCAEVNRTGTAVAGGRVVDQGHDLAVGANRIQHTFEARRHRVPWCLDGAGNQIVIAIVGVELSGSTDMHADMKWRELR